MPVPEMMIGTVPLYRVEELRIPNRIDYFTTDERLLAAQGDWLRPCFMDDAGMFDLVFQSWIIEVDGRVVLIDPCTGNGKAHPVTFFDQLDVPFIERMAETGYRPEDVELVVCTHLHHDHCGWNTQLRGGKWIPTFANARYVMQQTEVDRWGKHRGHHKSFDYNDGVFERSVEPILAAGMAHLVAGDERLTPGLTVQAARGHTIGHQMLHLVSNAQQAWFTGDSFHHPIQLIDPTIPFGDAEDQEAVENMRRRLVALSPEHDAWLIPAHLPAPHAVKAVCAEDGFDLCLPERGGIQS